MRQPTALAAIGALTAITVFALAAPASAVCRNVAERCVKNGGTRTVCFAAAYAAAQKPPYTYVGPYSHWSFQCRPSGGSAA